jgi:hypothetical protein
LDLGEPVGVFHGLKGEGAATNVVTISMMIVVTISAVVGIQYVYAVFFKESREDLTLDIAKVTIHGPTVSAPGELVNLKVKNSGNLDVTSWVMVEGASANGTELNAGDQVLVPAELGGPGPWVFKVTAKASGETLIEDVWVIDPL